MAAPKPAQVHFHCDPEAAMHAYYTWRAEQDYLEWELEADLERERELNPPMEEADIDYVDLAIAEDLCLLDQ